MAGTATVRAEREHGSVRAWDLPTRLFKWSLVAAVAFAWTSQWLGDRWLEAHKWNGYAVLVLLVFRLLWGFVGSSTARFSHWVRWPWTALRYAVDLVRGRGRPYLGHNPLGAWMIVALMAFVAGQALSGLFMVDSNGLVGGPFANLDFGDPTPVQRSASSFHVASFNVLLGLITLHVAVNLFYQFAKRDPVVRAMVTGTKPVEPFADEPAMTSPPFVLARAALCLGIASALVFGSIRLAGGAL